MGMFKFSEYGDCIDSHSKQAIKQIAEDKAILGYLTYGAMLAHIPMAIAASPHTMKRYKQRFHLNSATPLIQQIIEWLEGCPEASEAILAAQDIGNLKGYPMGFVALYIEATDTFCYLQTDVDVIFIDTYLTERRRYYISPEVDVVIKVSSNKVASFGMEASYKFAPVQEVIKVRPPIGSEAYKRFGL